ncbi:MAG: type II toxin-antitoxin system RelE/ParE family toxin, partial [Pirellulales bacterium]|nr:type II toxin-antitoxin system RelE/ParE family toxin [Pirellulales bacterium]
RDLHQNALWWADHRDVDQAIDWLEGFRNALKTLAENPQHHALAPEDHKFEFSVRQLLYGVGKKPTHRAVFRVRGDKVVVYTIRHLHQQELASDDL